MVEYRPQYQASRFAIVVNSQFGFVRSTLS
ncbi:hypothetical protein SAMN04488557_1368 [Hyphomicrobium facile]|uniref:Uncharacterized protein n=1 Tax=Hyphomicrobium facile TaxID=51670 RepID=A0A1I7N5K6_9HYPH|nr:hypothetical protein SAMN04488557_1368 [Hyphomicrobium facile]